MQIPCRKPICLNPCTMKIQRYAGLLLILLAPVMASAGQVTVYAAASLTNAMRDISAAYSAQNPGIEIRYSFAGSSTLAKQLEAGAPADIFVSADTKWMDYLSERKLIQTATRTNILGNTLVLIAPAADAKPIAMTKGIVPSFSGPFCMGAPDSVPAGAYGKQALTRLGWWHTLRKRIVGTEDVRAALAFVERGECRLGIVYETDSRISNKVTVVGRFPATSHTPILYPAALTTRANREALEFFRFLSSRESRAIFEKYGFVFLQRQG